MPPYPPRGAMPERPCNSYLTQCNFYFQKLWKHCIIIHDDHLVSRTSQYTKCVLDGDQPCNQTLRFQVSNIRCCVLRGIVCGWSSVDLNLTLRFLFDNYGFLPSSKSTPNWFYGSGALGLGIILVESHLVKPLAIKSLEWLSGNLCLFLNFLQAFCGGKHLQKTWASSTCSSTRG